MNNHYQLCFQNFNHSIILLFLCLFMFWGSVLIKTIKFIVPHRHANCNVTNGWRYWSRYLFLVQHPKMKWASVFTVFSIEIAQPLTECLSSFFQKLITMWYWCFSLFIFWWPELVEKLVQSSHKWKSRDFRLMFHPKVREPMLACLNSWETCIRNRRCIECWA